MPFYGRKRSAIVEQILEGKYEFRGRRWKKVSAQAKDFVQSLLVVDPSDRATAEEAYSMSWLNKRYTATVRPASDEELAMAKESLFRYSKYSGLKKVALMVIAHKSTSAEIGILRKIFQQYDTKKDGSLSYEEFKAAYAQAGLTADEFSALFDAIDLDGSGRIRYTEFLAATIEARGVISEERLAEAFDRIDSDDSGYITAANLKAILGDEFPDEEINAIIKEADLTLDGRISYAEFLALWEDRNEVPQDKAPTGNASQDSGSDVTPGGVDIVSRANFIESKQSAERRRSSLVELTGDHMEVLFKEEEVPVSSIPSVPSVIFDSSQVNVSERFGDATDLFEESPHRISAVV
jgi:Ca2+-binding EF-hand superfamily protein